ncbi:MAG: DUF4255 domain-containing protein [Nitrospirae bacterium]|nr:DUF4255 domain-containing protein [Nitrospirota bacterium]
MLVSALTFLKDELNAHIITRTGSNAAVVNMCKVVNETGKYAFEGAIGASIINIEEERVFKARLPEYVNINGRHVLQEPELKLNLHVLFAANFKVYDVALKYISHVLTFFQAHPSFTSAEYPALDANIEKLSVELQSLSYEQLNQVWAFIGGKQLPSVIYKVRMVALQDEARTAVQLPLMTIKTNIHSQ